MTQYEDHSSAEAQWHMTSADLVTLQCANTNQKSQQFVFGRYTEALGTGGGWLWKHADTSIGTCRALKSTRNQIASNEIKDAKLTVRIKIERFKYSGG